MPDEAVTTCFRTFVTTIRSQRDIPEDGKPDKSAPMPVRPLSFNSIFLADRNDYSAAGASSSVAGVSAISA